MATIALRVPTTGPDGTTVLVGGHCYIVFPDPTITVADLIAEKVRAELRKSRAGGPHTSTAYLLFEPNAQLGHSPHEEELAIKQAIESYQHERYQLWIEGEHYWQPPSNLIHLNRRTKLAFVITTALPASAFNVPQHEREGWLDRAVTERKTTNNYERRFHWSTAIGGDNNRYYVVSYDTLERVVFVYRAVGSVAEAYAFYQATAAKDITTWIGDKE